MQEDQLKKLSYNMAIKYIAKYSTTTNKLEKYLIKQIKKIKREGFSENLVISVVNTTISSLINMGYINDKSYALNKINNLFQSGKSSKYIYYKMQEDGIKKEDIKNIFNEVDIENKNLLAIIKFMRSKRFFCFRTKEVAQEDLYKQTEKEIASLLRAGFNFDLIRQVRTKSIEELEETYYNLRQDINQ